MAYDVETTARLFARSLHVKVPEPADDGAVLAAIGRKGELLSAVRRFREASPLKLRGSVVARWVFGVLREAGEHEVEDKAVDALIRSVLTVAFRAAKLPEPSVTAVTRIARDARPYVREHVTTLSTGPRTAALSNPAASPAAMNPAPGADVDVPVSATSPKLTAESETEGALEHETGLGSPADEAVEEADEGQAAHDGNEESVARGRWRQCVEFVQAGCHWRDSSDAREQFARLAAQLGDFTARVSAQHPPQGDRHLAELRSNLEHLALAATEVFGRLPATDEQGLLDLERDDVEAIWSSDGDPDDGPSSTMERIVASGRTWRAVYDAVIQVDQFERFGFPNWLWPGEGATSPAELTLKLLEDPIIAADLLRCRGWVEDHVSDEERSALESLDLPHSAAGAPVDLLAAAWAAYRARVDAERLLFGRIDALPSWLLARQGVVLRARFMGLEAVDALDLLEERCRRLGALVPVLHEGFLEECAGLLARPGDEELAGVAVDAAEQAHAELGDDVHGLATIKMMRHVARSPTRVPSAPAPPLTAPLRAFQVDHAMSKYFGTTATSYAATLVWVLLQGSTHFGLVRVPLRIKASPPLEAPLRLQISLDGSWRREFEHNPGVLANLTSEVTVGPGEFSDVEVVVPMTRPFLVEAQRRRRVEVAVTVAASDGVKESKNTLTWEKVRDALPEELHPFVQSPSLPEVQKYPLGVERHLDALRDLVVAGRSSFVVYGYRRFGKSTLVRCLCEMVDSKRVAVMSPIVAAGHRPEEVWAEVKEALERRFQRPVNLDLDGRVPGPHAFDAVRQEAAAKKLSAIYVLIDEAQALFPDADGIAMSERLKARLESHWGVRRDSEVPLLFGFIGQMSLRRVASGNLFAALNQFKTEPIGEAELVKLLRAMAEAENGLESTSEARQRLVALAGNLFVLKHALQSLQAQCRAAGRCWFIRSDVEDVFQELVEDARDNAGVLWKYVRDPLNESTNLDEWRPGEAFMVALAWAHVRSEGHAYRKPLERFNERLREVLAAWGSITVSEDRLQQVVRDLIDDRVLDENGEFSFPLLGRLFDDKVRQPMQFDEDERAALERLGLRRVRCPEDPGNAALVGGQARVFRSADSEAVRRIPLDRTDARRRFMREVALLQKLKEACEQTVGDWAEVRRYVPLLRTAGIDDRERGYGVVIYPWIEGHLFSDFRLDAAAIARVGRKLCLVLEKLAELEMVHSDIKPDNILLQIDESSADPLVPVLIDFGLARLVDRHGTATRSMTGVPEFLPPEVLHDSTPGRWTSLGDVFSLGRSLQKYAPPEHGVLREVLAGMTAPSLDARWSATKAKQAFLAIEQGFEREARTQEVNGEVAELFARLPRSIAKAVVDQKGHLRAALLGAFLEPRARMLQAASFLELAFKALVGTHPPIQRRYLEAASHDRSVSTYLAWASTVLRGEKPPWGQFADDQAALVGAMRNAWAHANDKDEILVKALRRLGVHSATANEAERKMRGALDALAGRMDAAFAEGNAAFEPIIKRWVHGARASSALRALAAVETT